MIVLLDDFTHNTYSKAHKTRGFSKERKPKTTFKLTLRVCAQYIDIGPMDGLNEQTDRATIRVFCY